MATEVLVPPLGTNVDTVTLVTWYRRDGEEVGAGEPLFAVETDKATLDVEAPAAGVLLGVGASEGDEVAALSRIAWICAAGEAPPAVDAASGRAVHGVRSVDRVHTAPAPAPAPATDRRFASPWARTLAAQRGIDWTAVHGTGPLGAVVARDIDDACISAPRVVATPLAAKIALDAGIDLASVAGSGAAGRITRADVLRAAEVALTSADAVEEFTLTGIRGKIADRMLRGVRETASVTLTAEVDATALVEARTRLAASGLRATYNDLLMSIVAHSLVDHPRLNATYDGERATVRRTVDIALAVDTERGLLAPVVRDVAGMALEEIAAATASIVGRARSGQIGPDELRGSTFTITNLGMYGIDAFTPIINLPECAILGVGRIRPTPWVVEGRLEVRQAMWLSLTFDHRLVDGGPAARFLQSVVSAIEAGRVGG